MFRSHTDLSSQEKHRYEAFLQFKERMRVVLQHNLDPEAGLVNGSQGMIMAFERYDEKRLPRARKEDDGSGGDAQSIVGSDATYQHY